jgi:di/tricarboxylate transporter
VDFSHYHRFNLDRSGNWTVSRLRMNRATIALVGSTILIIVGAIPLEKAYAAIDLDTIILLLSMTILNINLRLSVFLIWSSIESQDLPETHVSCYFW